MNNWYMIIMEWQPNAYNHHLWNTDTYTDTGYTPTPTPVVIKKMDTGHTPTLVVIKKNE